MCPFSRTWTVEDRHILGVPRAPPLSFEDGEADDDPAEILAR